MKYEAVVWDIDGTIVESEELHFKAFKNFISNSKVTFTGSYEDFIGKSLTDIIRDNFSKNKAINVKNAADEINNYYSTLISHDHIRDGVKEIIEIIKEEKFLKQGCASNGERKVVDVNLDNTGLRKYIDVALSCEDVEKKKPHPEIYEQVCRKLNVDPRAAIAVEDSPLGVEAAKKANMYVIAFPNKDTINMDFSKADFIAFDSNRLKNCILSKIGE